MADVVLDASALLALLNAEPGSEEVERTIPGAAVSTVNLSEVVAKLVEAGMPEEAVRSVLGGIDLEIHPFYLLSWRFRPDFDGPGTWESGLSLGDRACIALGLQLGAPVLTTDRNWKSLDVGVEVQMIR